MPDGPAARTLLPHRPSAAERLLRLPAGERRRALARLSDAQYEALNYDWEFWARPEQLAPAGQDWITWGIIAGRGAGKTRSAAEYVRAEVESGRSHHPFLIGADAADVRDVMVEGESGILAISPPWNRPKYEPSKRRLTWPNGVRGHLFGAHDPDSLRGPQCLIAGTLVTMADGSARPIERIVVGDLVATRRGARRVTWSGKTGHQRLVHALHTLDGRTLIGTGSHPVYIEGRGFVPLRDLRPGEQLCASPSERWRVPHVGRDSARAGSMPGSAHAPAPSDFTVVVRNVVPLRDRHDVYDITVSETHEFFANGVLVHNSDLIWCDEIAKWKYATQAWDNAVLGNRLGTHPRRVFTTTPKPIRLVRLLMGKDPSQRGQPRDPTVVIAPPMTTYDNVANLAPSFIQEVLTKYQGTRLGRQELLGHLLEDTPGALWTLEMIEQARTYAVPETFTRIVVAVDPAVTAHEESNETGIVVCAKGVDGLGYVLRDVSGRYSPDGWAEKVSEMYYHYHADRVVGEVNNGGDLVETMLRSKNADISYRAVHAARGKLTRAEPIAALYERHLIKHYGEYPELEEQMTTYAPDAIPSAQEKRKEKSISPDRMDALVWGMSELMLRRGGLFVA